MNGQPQTANCNHKRSVCVCVCLGVCVFQSVSEYVSVCKMQTFGVTHICFLFRPHQVLMPSLTLGFSLPLSLSLSLSIILSSSLSPPPTTTLFHCCFSVSCKCGFDDVINIYTHSVGTFPPSSASAPSLARTQTLASTLEM